MYILALMIILTNYVFFLNSGFLQVDIWMLKSGLFTQMFVWCQNSEAAAQYALFKLRTKSLYRTKTEQVF